MTDQTDQIPETIPEGVDTTKPNVARIYDHLLGGTTNFEIDRATAAKIEQIIPEIRDWAWTNRGFHQRAARWMALQAGVRQFLDIGSGLPTQNNTHQVVQAVAPGARVVYVDLDPLVDLHAQEVLRDVENTVFVQGDVRKPDELLANPELRAVLDFGRPVGLMMTALLHFVSDETAPRALIQRYLDVVPSGSYLALSHATLDGADPTYEQRMRAIYSSANEGLTVRTRTEIEPFFEGLELLAPYAGAEPSLTYGGMWGAEDPEAADDDAGRGLWVGVARKP